MPKTFYEINPNDSIHNTLFSSSLTNGSNMLEYYITLGWKSLAVIDTTFLGKFLSYEENEVLWMWLPGANVIKLYPSVIYKFSY
jgi:hypothetical protein